MKRLGLIWVCLSLGACQKVPIVDIQARFTLADVSWFAEEKTMFVFYELSAEQGLGPESQLEISWRTDNMEQPWAPLEAFEPVHTHLPTLCGPNTRCGSWSIKVVDEPRNVALRLRYHRLGEVFLDATSPPSAFNIVKAGPAHTNRSLIVYGVLDAKNDSVQWRARHQFPTMHNHEATRYGLRRYFRIEEWKIGELPVPMGNPYGYAFLTSCPFTMTDLGYGPIETRNRAVFDHHVLPLTASALTTVCARSVVTDATGTFAGIALARKNPEVAPAFPVLKTPIKANKRVGFLLRPCFKEISQEHLEMQINRAQLTGEPEICIDSFRDAAFPDVLAARLRARIDAVRADGQDMVLTLAVHHDDTKGELNAQIEKALAQILPFERGRVSPRVSGAFVFDSLKYDIQTPALRNLVLWCPANLVGDDLEKIPDTAQRSCPVQPDFPDVNLGPFKFSTIPILSTRPQYLTFIKKYSAGQAGRVTDLTFFAPERTTLSENVLLGDFGVGTFFNNEIVTAKATDAFSFCASGNDGASLAIFKSTTLGMPLPLSNLPALHELIPEAQYQIGLFWDFPYLTRLKYEATLAGAVTVFNFTVPFGIGSPSKAYYGPRLWMGPCSQCGPSDLCVDPGDGADCFPPAANGATCGSGCDLVSNACIQRGITVACAPRVDPGVFRLEKTLLQCSRFCDTPTFNSHGVYEVLTSFRGTYKDQCYLPRFPRPTDGEFPDDP